MIEDNGVSETGDGLSPEKSKLVVLEEYNPQDFTENRKSRSINISIENLREKHKSSTEKEARSLQRRFHAKIAPTDNKSAEDELRKEISKDMFAKVSFVIFVIIFCCFYIL